MISTIRCDKRISPFIREKIEDNGIMVEISEDLTKEDYAAIKVDEYYAKTLPRQEPKSVDFVVVVDCQCESYFMYILELKNVKGPEKLVFSDIYEKFSNTISLFLSEAFSDIFLNDKYKYKGVKLYLISDAYKEKGQFRTHEEFKKFREHINNRDTLKVDLNLSSRIFRFRGKAYTIEYEIPPNPIIHRWT